MKADESQIINIAGYKFISIENPCGLQRKLKPRCERWHLKGTVLLSHEGINLVRKLMSPALLIISKKIHVLTTSISKKISQKKFPFSV